MAHDYSGHTTPKPYSPFNNPGPCQRGFITHGCDCAVCRDSRLDAQWKAIAARNREPVRDEDSLATEAACYGPMAD
jgi:hypothetical protein